jgi:hypothetical protein
MRSPYFHSTGPSGVIRRCHADFHATRSHADNGRRNRPGNDDSARPASGGGGRMRANRRIAPVVGVVQRTATRPADAGQGGLSGQVLPVHGIWAMGRPRPHEHGPMRPGCRRHPSLRDIRDQKCDHIVSHKRPWESAQAEVLGRGPVLPPDAAESFGAAAVLVAVLRAGLEAPTQVARYPPSTTASRRSICSLAGWPTTRRRPTLDPVERPRP